MTLLLSVVLMCPLCLWTWAWVSEVVVLMVVVVRGEAKLRPM